MKIKLPVLIAIAICATSSLLTFQSCNKSDTTPASTLTTAPATYPGLSPTKQQRPLVLEQTADWCGYCPEQGTVMMKQMVEKYPNVIGISLHQFLDDLYSTYPLEDSLNNAFVNDLKGGIPDFNVDNIGSSQYPESNIQSEQTVVPVAGVGANSSLSGSKYTIKARVKFYSAVTGNYYLGVYAIQDGIIATGPLLQHDYVSILSPLTTDPTVWAVNDASYTNSANGTSYWFAKGSTYTHDHIISAGADGITSAWGQPLSQTSYAAGDSVSLNFTITASASWTSNISIVALLWKKNTTGTGAAYQYVNGYH